MHTCNPQIVSKLVALFARYGLQLQQLAGGTEIPGSYWGAPEAGLVGTIVYVRADTPLHSVLHEAAHAICMDSDRRIGLHTDAGGDYDEENAVCFFEIVLAQQLGVSVRAICADMDTWGYTFRLGSAYAWYTQDAADARDWLRRYGLITADATPTWRCRADTNAIQRRSSL